MDFFGADPRKYPPENFNFVDLKIPNPPTFNLTENRRVRWFVNYNTHAFQIDYWDGDEAFATVIEMHQDKVTRLKFQFLFHTFSVESDSSKMGSCHCR